MPDGFKDVGHFHAKYKLDHVCGDNRCGSEAGPREVNIDLITFRMKFLCEELQEFLEGVGLSFKVPLWDLVSKNADWDTQKSHAKMFDALMDLVYVAYGTAHVLGYPWPEGWDLVQTANMTKIRAERAEQSARGGTFDVIKPPGFAPPDIDGLLQRYGF